MRNAAILLLLAGPAAATVPASLGASQTLEALKAQGVRDGIVEGRPEDAARKAGVATDGNPFHIRTISPVEYVPADAIRRVETPIAEPPVVVAPRAPVAEPVTTPAAAPAGAPERSPTGRYYFEGKSPVQGITIYTAKPDLTGDGRTRTDDSGGAASQYGKYGTYALIGGAALAVAAFLVGGPIGIVLGVIAGAALGAGAIISFLTGKK